MLDPSPAGTMRHRASVITTLALLMALAVTGCDQSKAAHPGAAAASSQAAPVERNRGAKSSSARDLSADEAMGGHTLARHIGKSDDELRARLRHEPDISSASTYTDLATAEAVVGEAMASAGPPFEVWRNRTGRRPNFVLHFAAGRVIGRSIARERHEPVPCEHALVVVRWDDQRHQSYVLTSYPEERR